MNFIVGAYAASPSLHHPWNVEAEAEFMAGLKAMDGIAGLEIGFYEDIHRYDAQWFTRQLSPEWRHVITGLPGVMNRLGKNTDFGLASPDIDGKKVALDFYRNIQTAVQRLNDASKAEAVRAVVLHSAPKRSAINGPDGTSILADSLATISEWDWHGAELLVEHCDAPIGPHTPSKGFLMIESEIEAVKMIGETKTQVGMMINWGRSVVETRDFATPLVHIHKVGHHGLLRGLVFSGCSVGDEDYGTFADTHAPFAPSDNTTGCSSSLLTVDRAAECLRLADLDLAKTILGFKIQTLPASLSVEERLGMLRTAHDQLRAAVELI